MLGKLIEKSKLQCHCIKSVAILIKHFLPFIPSIICLKIIFILKNRLWHIRTRVALSVFGKISLMAGLIRLQGSDSLAFISEQILG